MQLKSHGQMVALDPLWPGRATVGGIVACNDSGAMRLKYGEPARPDHRDDHGAGGWDDRAKAVAR